jgi:hypothetical protein
MIPFDINRPRPVPDFCELVVNLEKSLGSTSASMPVPVSFTLTLASSFTSCNSYATFIHKFNSII